MAKVNSEKDQATLKTPEQTEKQIPAEAAEVAAVQAPEKPEENAEA